MSRDKLKIALLEHIRANLEFARRVFEDAFCNTLTPTEKARAEAVRICNAIVHGPHDDSDTMAIVANIEFGDRHGHKGGPQHIRIVAVSEDGLDFGLVLGRTDAHGKVHLCALGIKEETAAKIAA